MFTIYRIYNTIENKNYIGCTSNFEQRKKDHLTDNHKFSSIQHLFSYLPKESFEFSILHDNILDKDSALNIETEEIRKFNSVENGYNNCYYVGFGGGGNFPTGEEIGHKNWEKGSETRRLLLDARKRQPAYTKYNSSQEANKNKSEGVKAFYASKDPEDLKRIQEIRDRCSDTMQTEESYIHRRDINLRYDINLVARIRALFSKFDYWGMQADIARLCPIPYPTIKDIKRNRYYDHVEPNFDILEFIEILNGRIININWELLNESNK